MSKPDVYGLVESIVREAKEWIPQKPPRPHGTVIESHYANTLRKHAFLEDSLKKAKELQEKIDATL